MQHAAVQHSPSHARSQFHTHARMHLAVYLRNCVVITINAQRRTGKLIDVMGATGNPTGVTWLRACSSKCGDWSRNCCARLLTHCGYCGRPGAGAVPAAPPAPPLLPLLQPPLLPPPLLRPPPALRFTPPTRMLRPLLTMPTGPLPLPLPPAALLLAPAPGGAAAAAAPYRVRTASTTIRRCASPNCTTWLLGWQDSSASRPAARAATLRACGLGSSLDQWQDRHLPPAVGARGTRHPIQ